MNYIMGLILVSIAVTSNMGHAEIQAKFKRDAVYEKAFHTQYESGRCGDNIKRLLALWAKSKRNLQGVSVVIIKNEGFSVFGMVNAERARTMRFDKPATDYSNWYYHAIAVDREGYVYDFDFMTKPYILDFKRYLYYMFLDEPECRNAGSGKFCVGAKQKLTEYQMEWYRASDVLSNKMDKPFYVGSMGQSLKRVVYNQHK